MDTTVRNINEFTSSEFIDSTFEFWFTDKDHIRSPFPEYIRASLKEIAKAKFIEWIKSLSKEAKKDFIDEIAVEKFEEIIFSEAYNLVKTEDEKTTILYPFLPRINDIIKVKDVTPEESAQSKVIARSIETEAEDKFMKVVFKNVISGNQWETRFELP